VMRQVEILCKYEGYLARQEREVRRFQHLERILIPQDLDYDQVPGLSHEVRQLLKGGVSQVPGPGFPYIRGHPSSHLGPHGLSGGDEKEGGIGR